MRGKELRVQFNYRSSLKQKVVQQIRFRVESAEDADSAIRLWLQSKVSNKRVTKSSMRKTDTLFLRPIDDCVLQRSYHEHHNRKRKSKGGRKANTTEAVESTTTAIKKMQRARYAQRKRDERAHAKVEVELQV